MEPKQSDTSASSTHSAPRLASTRMTSRASWPDRFGRNPKLTGEVGLENRFEDDLRRRHHHPIAHGGNAERPGRARFALGDVHPPQWLGPIRLGPQLGGERVEELVHPRLLDGVDGQPIDTGSPGVGTDLAPGPDKHVAAGDLVVEGMEASPWILLGTAIQHALESSNPIDAFGVADGPSRSLGTHQSPSTPSSCIGEVGALRSSRVVLSRPSPLLRPPPNPSRPPATSRFRL